MARALKFIESFTPFNEEAKADPKKEQIRKQLADLKDRDDKLKRDHEMTRKALKSKGVMSSDRSASDTVKWKKDMEDYKKELDANKTKRADLRTKLKEAMDFEPMHDKPEDAKKELDAHIASLATVKKKLADAQKANDQEDIKYQTENVKRYENKIADAREEYQAVLAKSKSPKHEDEQPKSDYRKKLGLLVRSNTLLFRKKKNITASEIDDAKVQIQIEKNYLEMHKLHIAKYKADGKADSVTHHEEALKKGEEGIKKIEDKIKKMVAKKAKQAKAK